MASISNGKNGHRTIQFTAPDGRRRSLRLGKVSKKHAQAVKIKIENLVAAKLTGQAVDDETARWVAKLEDSLADRLARLKLIRQQAARYLGPFVDEYIDSRIDLKPRTIKKLRTTRDYLVEFFGNDHDLRELNSGKADAWRLFLMAKKGVKEENTLRKHAQIAKQFLHAAVRAKLLDENPFAELRSTVRPNPDRYFFVTREATHSLLEVLPDTEWRLIVALSRYGGLRCPSEHLALRWSDIDWAADRITITSPKTEHHPGGGSRVIPLFPELRTLLDDAYELANPGATFVVARYRDQETNLRTPLLRYIKRAGLTPWPKLFQNLRSSRQTELEEHFPSHVVCAWMGNSESVAQKHYLQVTAEHYAMGATKTSALQNPVQQSAATSRKASQSERRAQKKPLVMQEVTKECEHSRLVRLAEEGLEPPTRGL